MILCERRAITSRITKIDIQAADRLVLLRTPSMPPASCLILHESRQHADISSKSHYTWIPERIKNFCLRRRENSVSPLSRCKDEIPTNSVRRREQAVQHFITHRFPFSLLPPPTTQCECGDNLPHSKQSGAETPGSVIEMEAWL